jgi:8-amino-7-oxononanoate synthase
VLPDLTSEILSLKQSDLYRRLRDVETPPDPIVRVDGRDVLLFCSNNYLGLANDARVKRAAIACLETYGVSSAASRLISGNTTPHRKLEVDLARALQTEAALVYPTGYAANLGVIPTVVGPKDIIFSDSLNHRSLIDACRLSRAAVVVYDHADANDLASKMREHTTGRRRLIVTDGVFSMDGDLAPLDKLAELSREHSAILMVDDAHATGIFGVTGAGTAEHFGVRDEVDIVVTSASKGLGTFGGVVAGRQELIDLLINRSPAFIFTSAIPPDICAATSEALAVLDAEPERRATLLSHAKLVRDSMSELGLDTCGSQSHIIPVLTGDPAETLAAANFLIDHGIFVLGIRPPTVPEGRSRLRISLMSTHTDAHIESLLGALSEVRAMLNANEAR